MSKSGPSPAASEPADRRVVRPRTGRVRLAVAVAAVVAVVAAVAVMVAVKVSSVDSKPQPGAGAQRPRPGSGGGSGSASGVPSRSAETVKIIELVAGVPASVFDRVGKGSVSAYPKRLNNQPALRSGDKPLAIFIGSEACPHCATQRWAVAAAFSRFGTFSGLTTSPHDGRTPRFLSFHGASFTSEHLALQAAELASSDGLPLDELTAQQNDVMDRYGTGSVPFLDLGNRYVMIGSAYPSAPMSGKTALQIAEALDDPDSSIAQAVIGGANALTAAICGMTDRRPSEVCSSRAVRAYAGVF